MKITTPYNNHQLKTNIYSFPSLQISQNIESSHSHVDFLICSIFASFQSINLTVYPTTNLFETHFLCDLDAMHRRGYFL